MNDVKVLGLPAEKGRWLLVPLGILVLLCLGTAYSWTIFRTPVQQTFQSTATDSLLPFTTLLVVFSILMPITGFYIERLGPPRVVAVGAIIMGIGYILSGFANSIPAIILTYGVIAGAGVGIVYGVPLAVVAKWFPDKKGIAVGTTVIGFGLSPLITAPLASELIKQNNPDGWRTTLILFGIAFTLIMLAIATTLKYPPAGWSPRDWTPPIHPSGLPVTRGVPMLQTSAFWGLWLCFTIGTFAGLAAIGIARQVAEEVVKLDKAGIAWNVSLFAVFNGLGRPLFGWVADQFTPRYAAIACFVLLLIASLIMLGTGEGAALSYRVAFCLITLAFGGWLAISPTSTLLLFRPEDYAKNYGIVFTAFGMGALLGTLTAGQVRDLFGSYSHFFYVTAGLAVVGIVLAVFMLKRSPSTSRSLGIAE
jgi:OFA family oxalate/formate antiporter-like MFS transporter